MKKKISIGIVILLTLSLFTWYENTQSGERFQYHEEDGNLIIPLNESNRITHELNEIKPIIEAVLAKDPMNGFSNGSSTSALSKDGVKEIYTQLSSLPVCVNDEQGYQNLQKKEIAKAYINDTKKQKNAHFTCYTILKNGGLARKDFISEKDKHYLIVSYLDFEHNQLTSKIAYGKIITDIAYDEYGYFSYHIVLPKKIDEYAGLAYDGFRIDPLKKELREYNQKYIYPISYECNNLFLTDWDQDSIEQLEFSDLLKYLYVLDTDKPFIGSDYPANKTQYVREIDASFFEQLFMRYFTIDRKQLRKSACYDDVTNTYSWLELTCGASHYIQPKLYPEVIDAEKNQDQMILTIRATGYEKGIPVVFTHKVTLQFYNEGSFHYIENDIIASENHQVPEYQSVYPCTLRK